MWGTNNEVVVIKVCLLRILRNKIQKYFFSARHFGGKLQFQIPAIFNFTVEF